MNRTVEQILADWRAAEAERQDIAPDPELEERIERLRREYSAAVAAQAAAADESRRRAQ